MTEWFNEGGWDYMPVWRGKGCGPAHWVCGAQLISQPIWIKVKLLIWSPFSMALIFPSDWYPIPAKRLQSWTKVLGHMHFFFENFPFLISPCPPSPYQSWICGLKVHFFEATLTRGEGGRHFAQMWPFRVLKTERLANTCHILRLSQGLLSRIVWIAGAKEKWQ